MALFLSEFADHAHYFLCLTYWSLLQFCEEIQFSCDGVIIRSGLMRLTLLEITPMYYVLSQSIGWALQNARTFICSSPYGCGGLRIIDPDRAPTRTLVD